MELALRIQKTADSGFDHALQLVNVGFRPFPPKGFKAQTPKEKETANEAAEREAADDTNWVACVDKETDEETKQREQNNDMQAKALAEATESVLDYFCKMFDVDRFKHDPDTDTTSGLTGGQLFELWGKWLAYSEPVKKNTRRKPRSTQSTAVRKRRPRKKKS